MLKSRRDKKSFICAGQVLYVKVKTANDVESVTLDIEGNSSIVTLDELTKRFEYDEPKARGEKCKSINLLKSNYKMPVSLSRVENEEECFEIYYTVPYMTKQTLHSWNTLRNITKDAFDIDETKILSRIEDSYIIKIKAYSENGVVTKGVYLDVFERWDTLYNRDISKYVY